MRTALPALCLLLLAACSPTAPAVTISDEPLTHFHGQITEGPTTTDAALLDLYVRAAEALKQGDSDTALALYQQAIANYPSDPVGHAALGATHLFRKELGPAKLAYEKALALDPDNVEAHYGLGCVVYELGDQPGALAHAQAALAIDPEHEASIELAKLVQDGAAP